MADTTPEPAPDQVVCFYVVFSCLPRLCCISAFVCYLDRRLFRSLRCRARNGRRSVPNPHNVLALPFSRSVQSTTTTTATAWPGSPSTCFQRNQFSVRSFSSERKFLSCAGKRDAASGWGWRRALSRLRDTVVAWRCSLECV